MSQPLVARLLARQADARVDVLAGPSTAAIFRHMPGIGRVHSVGFARGRLELTRRMRLAREFAARRYQAAYVLPNTWKSALIPFLARIPRRVGYVGEQRYGLLNDCRRLDAAALPRLVDRYAALADPVGASTPAENPILLAKPALEPAYNSALAPTRRSAPGVEAGIEPGFELGTHAAPIVFCPGAEFGPAKRWPSAHFARLASALATHDDPVILLGSPGERAIGAAIAEAAPGLCRNLCGETTLDEALALIAGARLVVTNDSGLMHVAAAYRVPLVAIFGSSSPRYTPPLSAQAQVLSLGLACGPCFQRICPLGHTDCLNRLLPEQVLEAVQALRAERPR